MEEKKVCRLCGEAKEATEFDRDSRSPDGRRARCRACRRTHERSYHRPGSDAAQRLSAPPPGAQPLVDLPEDRTKIYQVAAKNAVLWVIDRHRDEYRRAVLAEVARMEQKESAGPRWIRLT